MSLVARAVVWALLVGSQPPERSAVDGIVIGGADPTIVAVEDGRQGYYVVATGRGIPILHSADLKQWRRIGRVFAEDVPTWARQEVPGADNIWAPDLSFHDGRYHLYYSVSTFGSQRSVIGLAVNQTLDPQSREYRWVDRGKVLESAPGKCDFNAIDPALSVDREGSWHLFFGSFWTGIKAVRLDPATGKPPQAAAIVPVAARPRRPPHAIEAAYVIYREGWYYLFVSWDRCCDGADSDYKVLVGRARRATGPYVDADGRPLLDGGGTLVLAGNDRWRGPGHNSVLTTTQGQWLVHHTYDVHNLRAQRILQIRPLSWSREGWPEAGQPIAEPPARPSRSVLRPGEPRTLGTTADDTPPPATSEIRADEQVVFFPTSAHLLPDSRLWIVPVHGVIYEPEGNSLVRGVMVQAMSRLLEVEAGSTEAQTLDRQLRLFWVDNERGKSISVRIGRRVYEVGTSGPDGHFEGELRLSAGEIADLPDAQKPTDGFLRFEAVTRPDDERRFVGRAQLVGPTGLSLISDIDDTIKHSQVGDPQAVLTNTFLRQFTAVPGMPELYRQCAQRGVVFHYVSGSPWQLYLPLAEFLVAAGLPAGSFDLKHFRLKDSSMLSLLQSQEAFKVPAIERIMTRFPHRKFVLIGDSGEQDPEIYAQVARQHGAQIAAILIRNVTGEQIDNARFEAVRKGLGDLPIRLFDQPAEVRPLLEELWSAQGQPSAVP